MKLTIMVKLLASEQQQEALERTLRRANAACDYVSDIAWERRTFSKYGLQRAAYYDAKARFELSAQVVILLLAKVADAYKRDRKTRRTFRPLGAIAYDDRILRWYKERSEVSVWTVGGRERIRFACDERTRSLLALRKGQSDLVYRDGKWYLLATVEVSEHPAPTPQEWIGVDLGIANLATDSDGETHTSAAVERSRRRYERIRSKLQRADTKSAKRHLKKLSRRERRMKRDANHRISKRLVSKAADTNRGIRLEELKGIRERRGNRLRKPQRSRHAKWAFLELRSFVEYKARLAGVAVEAVDPAYTSQTCSACGHRERSNRRNRDDFRCKSCGHAAPADLNAAVNISRGAVMRPIVSENEGCANDAPSTDFRDKPAATAAGS